MLLRTQARSSTAVAKAEVVTQELVFPDTWLSTHAVAVRSRKREVGFSALNRPS